MKKYMRYKRWYELGVPMGPFYRAISSCNQTVNHVRWPRPLQEKVQQNILAAEERR